MPDTRGCASHHNHFVFDSPFESTIDKQIWIEIALPIIPDRCRIAGQRWTFDTSAAQYPLGFTIIKLGGVTDKLQGLCRNTHIFQNGVTHPLNRRQAGDTITDHFGNKAKQTGVDPHRHARGMTGLGKNIEHLTNTVRLRVGEVEAIYLRVGVSNGIHCINDVIDRNDIEASTFKTDGRHPLGKSVTQLLQHLEEVVGAINLIDFTSLGMTNDHTGAIDFIWHLATLFTDDFFCHMFGAQIGIVKILCLLKHIFTEDALVESSRSYGADMMKITRPQGFGTIDRRMGTLNIGQLLSFAIRLQIIDSGQMKEVIDTTFKALSIICRESKIRSGQITDDGMHTLSIHAKTLLQAGKFF